MEAHGNFKDEEELEAQAAIGSWHNMLKNMPQEFLIGHRFDSCWDNSDFSPSRLCH